MRLVQLPSARYSMMPPAMEPAMPSASTICLRSSCRAAPTPAAAPMAPNTAVGWKPALCTAFGTTMLKRQMTSTPTAMPAQRRRAVTAAACSAAASTAGTITAPACTGPPSKVSSKSSPCAAVPLTKAAPAALSGCGVADRGAGAGVGQAASAALHVVGAARGDAQADDVDQQPLAGVAHGRRQARGIDTRDCVRQPLGDRCAHDRGFPHTSRSRLNSAWL